MFKHSIFQLQKLFTLMSCFKDKVAETGEYEYIYSDRTYIAPKLFRTTLPIYF